MNSWPPRLDPDDPTNKFNCIICKKRLTGLFHEGQVLLCDNRACIHESQLLASYADYSAEEFNTELEKHGSEWEQFIFERSVAEICCPYRCDHEEQLLDWYMDYSAEEFNAEQKAHGREWTEYYEHGMIDYRWARDCGVSFYFPRPSSPPILSGQRLLFEERKNNAS